MLALTVLPGHAAQIEVSGSPDVRAIAIVGTIEAADTETFQEKTRTLTEAVVLLSSNGGDVVTAIRIGEMIRARRFSTFVTDTCASACTLIWLAGSQRYMSRHARIGFHQASNGDTGEVSGAGNALVGSYLTRLGLSYDAVLYATSAPPDDIKWMTPVDARHVGIDVRVLDPDERTEHPATAAVPRTLSDLAAESESKSAAPPRPRTLSDLAAESEKPAAPARPRTLSDLGKERADDSALPFALPPP
jgi:membrane-bound ClpP family serine protease